jgi:OOP family OmpA-OmpF porin
MFQSTITNKIRIKKSRLIVQAFTLLALAGIAGMAQAAGAGWYMGASAGESRAKDYFRNDNGYSVAIDDKDSTWRIYGGYHLMDIVAIEAGYVDLGTSTAVGTFGGSAFSDKNEASGIDAVIVGTMRMTDNISAIGKLGYLLYDVDSETTQLGVSRNNSDTGIKYTYGAGAKYDLGKKYALRFEWQRYTGVGNGETGESHYDGFSLGLMVNLK